MNKKRIYMVLEVQHRELDARIAFAIKASQLGYSTVFCKKAYLYSKSKYLTKGVVILKSIGKKNIKFISTLKKDGHVVCSFDEEGLLFHDSEKYCKRRLPLECFNQIKYFFAWGKNDAEAIKSFFPSQKQKIKITGNARIELLKKPLNQIYIKGAEEIKKRYGEFILVNTKFGYANYIMQNKNFSIVDGLSKAWNLSDKEKIFYKYILESQIKRRQDLKDLLDLFEIKHPKIKFIIRPHQSETPDFWNNVKNRNVIIIRDGNPSISWMIAAKNVISFNCTTAIEAKFFDIDHLNYVPLSQHDFELPNLINKNFDNIIDLEKFLIENNKTQDKKLLNIKELKNNIENIDSDYVSNIIEFIKDEYLNFSKLDKDRYSNSFFLLYFRLKRFIINLFTVELKKLKKDNAYRLLLQKNPNTNISNIKKRSREIMDILDLNKDKIKISEIYPDVYCYESINDK